MSIVVLQSVSSPGGVAGRNCEVRSINRDGVWAMSDCVFLSDMQCIVATMRGRLLNNVS